MKEILFVCTGNTCRGPMAEAFFNDLCAKKLNLTAKSAGLYTDVGIKSPRYAVSAAKELGADISQHLSIKLSSDLGENAKYVVCLTAAHKQRLLQKYPNWESKTILLSSRDIKDPFGGNLQMYRETAKEIYSAIESMLREGKINGY